MRRKRERGLSVLTLALVLALGCASPIAVIRSPIQEAELLLRIEAARTADDHVALESYYRAQARAMEANASQHDEMAKKYESLGWRPDWPSGWKPDWSRHCRSLAAGYSRSAAEYEELAELHAVPAARLRGEP